MNRFARIAVISLGLASVIGCSRSEPKKPLTIATAASLAGVFEKVADAYTQATKNKVSLAIQSSGTLAQQIREGAPYDLFASANLLYVNQLVGHKAADPSTLSVFSTGQLVMWVKQGQAPKTLTELRDDRFAHIAIANPEHAPYGEAAKEALEAKQLWSDIESKLVRGSNVRQAMQYVESGNAEVGLIAHSLAIHSGGSFTMVDPHLHKPLEQAIVVTAQTSKKKQASEFIQFLATDAAKVLFAQFGFQVKVK